MSLKRKYKLNMPQLLWGGLSENWMLKEFGDAHWQQITTALETASNELVDSRGERLYASFVRLRWSGDNIGEFKENDDLELSSKLSRYGSKMFFSETLCKGTSGKLKANLMSVFSTRESSDNTQLKKGTLKAEINSKNVKTHRKLPVLAKEYLDNKIDIFDDKGTLKPAAYLNILYRKEYAIDAYDDINGVGLLYFASYPKISDKCEREYMHFHYKLKKDWLDLAGVCSRDIHYYGNANPGENLIYELNTLDENNGKVEIKSSLYRESDMCLIARVTAIKQLKKGTILRKRKNAPETGVPITTTEKLSSEKDIKYKLSLPKNTDRNTLNNIIIGFLESMLEIKGLSPESDINALGIESIVYQELSEFLYTKYKIDSNPSRFYGASTVNNLSDYLLEMSSEVGKEPVLESVRKEKKRAVAVVGMSGRFPSAANLDEFWENLLENKDLITEAPIERWDWESFNLKNNKAKPRWGGFIDNVDKFDPLFFGISPLEAELMDPQQRITLEAVYKALEDAAIKTHSIKGSNTGIYIGVSGSDYAHLLGKAKKDTVDAFDAIGTSTSILVNRISFLLDIMGPSQAIDTACSSSLVALHEAVKSIENGICDMAFAGGVHTMFRPEVTISYGRAGMLSEDGRCKTFDEKANGYVRGEGVGIVLLKSLEQAERGGDHIYGVIRGSFVNHGGKANTLTSPNPHAQKSLIYEANRSGSVSPEEISYIEAHGTGTPLGDPIEIEGLKLAFEKLKTQENYKENHNYCGIGSVKANIGHLEAAAGIAGFIKVLLCLKNQTLVGNPHLKKINKYIELEQSPFYLRKNTSFWEVEENKKRVAGVSSFGFGGVNSHIIVEEYTKTKSKYLSNTPTLIVLSAKNEKRLQDKVSELKNFLRKKPDHNIYEVAYTLQSGRDAMEERLAFVALNIPDLIEKLEIFETGNRMEFALGNIKKSGSDFSMDDDIGRAYLISLLEEGNYMALGTLWTRGIYIDWSILYSDNRKPHKISLPTYPFSKQRYWFEEKQITETEDSNISAVNKRSNGTILAQTTTLKSDQDIRGNVESFLMQTLTKVLKLEAADIDLTADISDYGIDSIMSDHLITGIKDVIPEAPQLLFLEYRTFNDVIDYLVNDHSECFRIPHQPKNTEKPVLKPIVNEKKSTGFKKDYDDKSADIAIIGISGLLPKSKSLHDFFEHLNNGNIVTSEIPNRRLELLGINSFEREKVSNFYGGFIEEVEYFDHNKFKFSKEEAIQMDPQLRKLIESVWLAIGNSGYKVREFQKEETGVFVATRGHSGYCEIMKRNKLDYEIEFPALYANRLSHVFNLKGPSEIVDTGCSAFIAALERASYAFKRGACSQAIVSTATLNLSYEELSKKDLTGVYSKQNITRSFSEDSDGFVRSEAIGTMIVKPLEKARQDGDYIYGVVKGIGVYHGGKSPLKWNSPNIKGQKMAIKKALDQAKINPLTIDYIEAEANGMSFVDSSEMVSIQSVYGDHFENSTNGWKDKTIFIGSLKPLVGHAETSSTFPCLLKLILSTRNKRLYGIKGLNKINSAINLKHNFSILREDRNWPEEGNHSYGNHPRRMAMNCLGIGGVNTHLIFEGHEEQEEPYFGKTHGFGFCFSDESEEQLAVMLEQYLYQLPELKKQVSENELLNRLEFTLLSGRQEMNYRLAIQADTLKELLEYIEKWVELRKIDDKVYYNYGKIEDDIQNGVKSALTINRWIEILHLWVRGARINWESVSNYKKQRRIPLPTPALKKEPIWPFPLNKVDTVNTNRKKKSSSLKSYLWEYINGQTKLPYKIGDNSLFLFGVEWRKASVKSKPQSPTTVEHHIVSCYVEDMQNDLPKNTEINYTMIPAIDRYSGSTFIQLAKDVFKYLQNLLKKKPKNDIAVQILVPAAYENLVYGLVGLIHTCRFESSRVKPQLIFIDNKVKKENLYKCLVNDLNRLNDDLIIKHTEQSRYVEAHKFTKHLQTPILPQETYKRGEVILITGGMGGLGLMVTNDILNNCKQVTIVLTGRSELNDQRKLLLEKLNSRDAKVEYHSCDISKKGEVKKLINSISGKHGGLNGIIHCAGIIKDNYIVKKNTREIQQVLAPKVLGAEYLDEFTKKMPIRFFLCFSSLHSYGNAGQADYAMSNAYLDGFIRNRNELTKSGQRNGIGISMNWPYWENGGMQLGETALDLMKEIKGSVPLPSRMGMDIMHYTIQKGLTQLIIDYGENEKIAVKHGLITTEETFEKIK